MTFASYLELVRAPAALTVIGDTLVGAASSGRPLGARGVALPLASVFLYAAGMALNDFADRELDAVERPERPIPSGRISPRQAIATAVGLTAAGLAVAAAAGGRRSFFIALPLTVSIWLYDTVAKPTLAGPAVMATCRGLDVLMGAGTGSLSQALPSATIVAAHTAGVTALARGEVHGTTSNAARAVAIGTAANAVAAMSVPTVSSRANGASSAATAASGLLFAATAGPGQVQSISTPDAATVRRATGRGIRAMVPLQLTLASRAGAWGAVVTLTAVEITSRVLSKRRSSPSIT